MLQLHGKPLSHQHLRPGRLLAYFFCHRLNYQHYLWQNAAGFYLHPDIPQLQPNAHVADVATGSGYSAYLSTDVSPSCSYSAAEDNPLHLLDYGSSISHRPFLLQQA